MRALEILQLVLQRGISQALRLLRYVRLERDLRLGGFVRGSYTLHTLKTNPALTFGDPQLLPFQELEILAMPREHGEVPADPVLLAGVQVQLTLRVEGKMGEISRLKRDASLACRRVNPAARGIKGLRNLGVDEGTTDGCVVRRKVLVAG